MFDKLLEDVASQGAMGILLALLILMFIRFFNKTFDAQVERDRAHTQFMQNCLATMQEIKTACMSCRGEIINSEMVKLGAAEDRIIAEVRSTGQLIIADTRRDNDLSRPHAITPTPPPVTMQSYSPVTPGSRKTP